MAVRVSKAYQHHSRLKVLGAYATTLSTGRDYPLHAFDPGLDLDPAARVHAQAIAAATESEEFEGAPELFPDKRRLQGLVGTWGSAGDSVALQLYMSLPMQSNKDQEAMAVVLEAAGVKEYHGDAKSIGFLLSVLMGMPPPIGHVVQAKACAAVAVAAADICSATSPDQSVAEHAALTRIAGACRAAGRLEAARSAIVRLTALSRSASGKRFGDALKNAAAKGLAKQMWWDEELAGAEEELVEGVMLGSGKHAAKSAADSADDVADAVNWDDVELMDAAEEAIAGVKVRTDLLSLVGSRVIAKRTLGPASVFATRAGIALVVGAHSYLLSHYELNSADELLAEAQSAHVAIAAEFGPAVGASYISAVTDVWASCSSLTEDGAGAVSCAHRDLELAVKAVDSFSFKRDGTLESVEEACASVFQDYGDVASVLSIYMARRPSALSDYHWVRSLRCVPLCYFSRSLLCNTAKANYGVVHEASPEFLERLSLSMKFQIGAAYQAVHGECPEGYAEAIEEARAAAIAAEEARHEHAVMMGEDSKLDVSAAESVSVLLDSMALWDHRAKAPFDWTAASARDKANIDKAEKVLKSCSDFDGAGADMRREILYYGAKGNSWEDDVAGFKTLLSGGFKGVISSHVTVKPEPKEGGRAVTSERCDARKFNSVTNANLMPYVETLKGSMMAASPRKRESTIHEMAAENMGFMGAGMTAFYLTTDFTKFAHSLSIELQLMAHRVVGEFFGVDEVCNIPTMLKKQRVCCTHGGIMASFRNETGGDGQGMRNAVWELMLAAMPMFVTEQVETNGVELEGTRKMAILYFMDDHLFRFFLGRNAGKEEGGRPCERLLRHLNKIEDGVITAYSKVGLAMNPSKNQRSLRAAALTGMKISMRGRERVEGRAINRAMVTGSHRAPSVVEDMEGVSGAAVSAVEDGFSRAVAMAVVHYCSAVVASRYAPKVVRSDPVAVALSMVMPRASGGLGVLHESHLIVRRGVVQHDDELYCLFRSNSIPGANGEPARGLLQELEGSTAQDGLAWGMAPGLRKNTKTVTPSSPLSGALWESHPALAAMQSECERFKKHLLWSLKTVSAEYEVIPSTAVAALVSSSPYTAAQSELMKMCGSATAQALLSDTALANARRAARKRSFSYFKSVSRWRARSTGRVQNWSSVVATAGLSVAPVLMDFPPRHPSCHMIHATDEPSPEVSVHRVGAASPYPLLEPSKGSGTNSRTASLWQNPRRAALTAAVDTETACRYSLSGSRFGSIVASAHGVTTTRPLAVSENVHSPFRDLVAVQVAPASDGAGVRRELRDVYATAEATCHVRTTLGDTEHVNYSAALSLAVSRAGKERSFMLTTAAVWKEPVFKRRAREVARSAQRAMPREVYDDCCRVVALLPAPRATLSFGRRKAGVDDLLKMAYDAEASRRRGASAFANLANVAPNSASAERSALDCAVERAAPQHKGSAVITTLAAEVCSRLASSSRGASVLQRVLLVAREAASADLDEIVGLREAFAPTEAECAAAYDMAVRCNCVEPFFASIDRVYRAACGHVLEGVLGMARGPPQIRQVMVTAYMYWCQVLSKTAGQVCAVGAKFSSGPLYRASAKLWATRHKVDYSLQAWVISLAKAKLSAEGKVASTLARDPSAWSGADVNLICCLAYEAKARVMDAAAQASAAGASGLEAVRECERAAAAAIERYMMKRAESRQAGLIRHLRGLQDMGKRTALRVVDRAFPRIKEALRMVAYDCDVTLGSHTGSLYEFLEHWDDEPRHVLTHEGRMLSKWSTKKWMVDHEANGVLGTIAGSEWHEEASVSDIATSGARKVVPEFSAEWAAREERRIGGLSNSTPVQMVGGRLYRRRVRSGTAPHQHTRHSNAPGEAAGGFSRREVTTAAADMHRSILATFGISPAEIHKLVDASLIEKAQPFEAPTEPVEEAPEDTDCDSDTSSEARLRHEKARAERWDETSSSGGEAEGVDQAVDTQDLEAVRHATAAREAMRVAEATSSRARSSANVKRWTGLGLAAAGSGRTIEDESKAQIEGGIQAVSRLALRDDQLASHWGEVLKEAAEQDKKQVSEHAASEGPADGAGDGVEEAEGGTKRSGGVEESKAATTDAGPASDTKAEGAPQAKGEGSSGTKIARSNILGKLKGKKVLGAKSAFSGMMKGGLANMDDF